MLLYRWKPYIQSTQHNSQFNSIFQIEISPLYLYTGWITIIGPMALVPQDCFKFDIIFGEMYNFGPHSMMTFYDRWKTKHGYISEETDLVLKYHNDKFEVFSNNNLQNIFDLCTKTVLKSPGPGLSNSQQSGILWRKKRRTPMYILSILYAWIRV